MLVNVNPTRMELLKLRKRVKMARRGHKLLKDKRDELMKEFLALVRETRQVRERVEEGLARAGESFMVVRAVMSAPVLEDAIRHPSQRVTLSQGKRQIMNVVVPTFTVQQEGEVYGYGFAGTSAELDTALGLYAEVLPWLVRLAELEKAIELMADEIEKTRRRVNALEYVLIPQLETAAKDIAMKLGEQERGNITRLMKIKDIVRAH